LEAADCLKNIRKPKVEVHISNIYKREEFRQKSVTAANTDAVLSGFGMEGYRLAVLSLK
jgi:3-dehydroquinate dehydratase-2